MSVEENPAPEQQRNPITQAAHRKQAFWQIYFPLILFGILVVVAIVLVVLIDDRGASKWADISLIYIIAIAMIAFLVTTILLVMLVVYTARLSKATPFFFFKVQRIFYLTEIRVKDIANIASEPFLRINSFIAGVRALRRK
ncbi:MAG: hypothetical protein ACK2UM_01560 [Anaerolineales bacterium]|jgi:K+-sensing histidine kinase KdpD